MTEGTMSKEFIEAEKKRLDEFLAHQALLHEQNKQRALEHADNAVVLADFAI